MKEGLHPDYTPTKVVCACGNVIETRSTRGDFHVDICNACHPFFTGKQKLMDTAGRIEKFKTRYAATPEKVEKAEKAAALKAAAAPVAQAPKKAAAPKENRAAKRAKSNAGKPKPPKTEAPAEAAAEAKPEGETA